MKKNIVIILITCIMLCGCSNDESKPQQTAPITEQNKTTTSDLTEVPAPTKDSIETYADDTSDKLQELNNEIQSELESIKLETDAKVYDNLCLGIEIAMADPEIYVPLSKIQSEVVINEDGLTFNDMPDSTAEAIRKSLSNIVGDLSTFVTNKEYSMTIDKGTLKRTNPPIAPEK